MLSISLDTKKMYIPDFNNSHYPVRVLLEKSLYIDWVALFVIHDYSSKYFFFSYMIHTELTVTVYARM